MFSLFGLFAPVITLWRMLTVSHIKLNNSSIFLKSVLKLYFKHFYLKLLNSCLYEKKSLSRHTEVYVFWCCEVTSGCPVL